MNLNKTFDAPVFPRSCWAGAHNLSLKLCSCPKVIGGVACHGFPIRSVESPREKEKGWEGVKRELHPMKEIIE